MLILRAEPNPVPAGLDPGTTTIEWDTGSTAEARLHWRYPDGRVIVIGRGCAGTVEVSPVVVGGFHTAQLYIGENSRPAAEVHVTRNFWPRAEDAMSAQSITRSLDTIDLGDLRRTVPISSEFGFDRGQPIDRFYIEHFLRKYQEDIRGSVLEVQDDSYTRHFGSGRAASSDILDIHATNPPASIIADLNDTTALPSRLFDCVILSQTLQLLRDPASALRSLHGAMKPGGVLLATFPGISQTTRDDLWYWRFTPRSAANLFGSSFGESNIAIETYGNVLTEIALLHGLSAWELPKMMFSFTTPPMT